MRRFIAAFLLAACVRGAAATDTITWLTSDLPPFFITSGELEGKGGGDLQTSYLAGRLSQFKHRSDRASIARIWHEIGTKDGICTVGALRSPERDKLAIFSNRPFVVPSYRLIVDNRKLLRFRPYMTESGEVDLDRLATDPALRGGYVFARLHSAQINAFVDSAERRATLEKLGSTVQIFHLMHLGRLDFIFAAPYEINYYKVVSHYTEEITTLPIKDSPRSVKGYVACSALRDGRAVIAAVDTVLSDDGSWAAFLSPMKRWMAPADFAITLAAKPGD